MAEQKEQRPPSGEENGKDPYAGSTDENTDNEGPPESPNLPIPELPGGKSSLLMWDLALLLLCRDLPQPVLGWLLPPVTCLSGSSPPVPGLCHLLVLLGLFPSFQHPLLTSLSVPVLTSAVTACITAQPQARPPLAFRSLTPGASHSLGFRITQGLLKSAGAQAPPPRFSFVTVWWGLGNTGAVGVGADLRWDLHDASIVIRHPRHDCGGRGSGPGQE